MSTDEQRDGRDRLRAALDAAGLEWVRITRDEEGWPIVSGARRRHRIAWQGLESTGASPCVYVFTTSARMIPKIAALPGAQRHQIGEREGCIRLPVTKAALQAACALIQARKRRQGGGRSAEHMAKIRPPRAPILTGQPTNQETC